MPVNRLKRALAGGQLQIGLWSTLASHIAAEVSAGSGFDWLLLDIEHAPNDVSTVHRQLQAIQGSATSAVVRPAWNDPVVFKRLLDIGVQSLVVPFVQNAEEARRAVAATRYPPAGVRGVSVSQRSNRYGSVPDYLKTVNDNIAVMVQIESGKGVAAAAEIAAVDGVDGLFIGPSDLAAAFGHLGNAGHADVQQAMTRVYAAGKAAGKAIGTLAPVEADARRYLEMGATFVAVGSDLGVLRMGTQALHDKFRGPDAVPIAAQY